MCGISGYIAKGKPISIQKTIIKTLGVFNDTRGGDSCGLYIDGNIEIGVDKTSDFSDFMLSSDILKNTKDTKVVFTHCRKRSVGAISSETAQPVVFKNDEGEIDYVLMHNGTIHNADELWEKHNTEQKLEDSLTDSQKMAMLFYHYGYDELANYNGAAVFAIVDYRKNRENPEVLFWKGESISDCIQKTTQEERPFYFVYDKGCMIFSSIQKSLKCVSEEKVYTIKSNTLSKLSGGTLIVKKEYDRLTQYQVRKIDQSKKAIVGYGVYANQQSFDYGDNYNNNYNKYNYYNNTYNQNFMPNKKHKKEAVGKLDYRNLDGCIYFQNKKADGKFEVSAFGYSTSFEKEELWFYNGYLLLGGKDTYLFLTKMQSKYKEICSNKDEFAEYFVSVIRKYSYLPVWSNRQEKFEIEPDYGSIIAFDGNFITPFSTSYKENIVKDGKIINTEKVSYTSFVCNFNKTVKDVNNFVLNIFDAERELLNYYNLDM
jgi:hypothetical protein